MVSRELKRVVFFSTEDMSSGYNLLNAAKLLENFDFDSSLDINDLLELYNIQLYFDNEIFLPTWESAKKIHFIEIVNKGNLLLKHYFLAIDNSNIIDNIEKLDFNYKNNFWELISKFAVYKKIDKGVFSQILTIYPFQITYALKYKKLVNHFDNEITSFLISYESAAELLLSNYEEKHTSAPPEYQFPNSLSFEDKGEIVTRYITGEDANLNYLRLIETSTSPELKLSNRIKLQARKRAEDLTERIFEDNKGWKVGVQVTLDKDQIEPVVFSIEDHVLNATYGEHYLDTQKSDAALFLLFKSLFAYVDQHGLITLISKQTELGLFEKISMRSNKEYLIGVVFRRKDSLALSQMVIFNHYLNEKGGSLERLIKGFVTEYLNQVFEIKDLSFKIPSDNATYLEKIRVFAPELEGLLKQYELYVIEGRIDIELLQFSSAPLFLGRINSQAPTKYLYIKDDSIKHLIHHFFSDQSGLYYTEKHQDRYNNFYDLLSNEKVLLNDFANFQKHTIEQLLQKDYLYIDSDNIIKIAKPIFFLLLRELHRSEVLSYWHYSQQVRNVIDEMLASNLLKTESTLFSKFETNYFNFYLNKKEFTNGMDLRNKYLHGTNPNSENENKLEYFILLRLIILAVLKIHDDLSICKLANQK